MSKLPICSFYSCLASFALLLAIVSCGKKNYGAVKLMGHAGDGLTTTTAKYPPNSAEAVQYAVNVDGIDGCEVDCQLSADGTIWLYHDLNLDDLTTGTGCINERTDAYLESIHFRSLGKEKLVKLKDLDFPYEKKYLLLDVRHSSSCSSQTIDFSSYYNGIQSALGGKNLSRVAAISVDVGYVSHFVELNFPVYYEIADFSSFSNTPAGAAGICIKNADLSKEQASQVRAASMQLIIFEVRAPKPIRQALKKYPDFLLVDDLNTAIIEKY